MNKAYRVVFNKAIGVWMAVSEIARGRGKGRSVVRAVGSALIAGAALFSAPGAMAQALIEQPDDGGPVNIGSGVTGGSVNFSNVAGQNRRLTGIENGVGTTDAVTVNQLNGALTALGGRINTVTGAVVAPSYTLGADSKGETTYSTVPGALGNLDDRIKGNAASIVNNTTNITNLTNGTAGMVQQAGAGAEITVAKDTGGDAVNFAGKDADGNAITRKLTNVTAGTADNDAVNVQQLKNAGLIGDDGSIANAVIYDDATKSSVTLNKGGAAVQLGNVANGKVEADSKDAVNGGQLHSVKTVADKAAEDAAQAGKDVADLGARAVKYDSIGDSVTLNNGSGNPVQIKNVADGKDDHDAVNVQQLKNAGLVGDDGSIANVVVYDDATKSSVTLNKGGDAVKLSNVANGVAGNDAVNFSQLNGVGSALGGGAGFDKNGVWTGPTYTYLNGDKSTNVGDALSKLDSRVFTLEGSTSIGSGANDKFAGSGANMGDTTKKEVAQASGNYATASGANAVASGQSSTASGANAQAIAKNSVALGADSIADRESTVSVGSVGNERFIANVKAGVNDTDAVNYGQFKDVKAQADATQQAVGSLQSQVNQMDSKINRVGAMNAAMSTMVASAAGLQTDNRMAIGTGLYRGQTALAIGYQRKVGSRATVTIGGSTAGGSEYNVGVGAGYGW